MTDRYQTVLLFGAPGAGKGTQGELLGGLPGFFHMSTGDMFRSLDKQSELGTVFFEYSSKGELVPDEVTIDMWRTYMNALRTLGRFRPHRDLLVLDGMPRTSAQTELIAEAIEVRAVIHLVASDREAMIERLRRRAIQQGRTDDAKENVVRNRIDVYERETRPVLDRYDRSIIHDVDAIGTQAEVLKGVLDAVNPIRRAVFNED